MDLGEKDLELQEEILVPLESEDEDEAFVADLGNQPASEEITEGGHGWMLVVFFLAMNSVILRRKKTTEYYYCTFLFRELPGDHPPCAGRGGGLGLSDGHRPRGPRRHRLPHHQLSWTGLEV